MKQQQSSMSTGQQIDPQQPAVQQAANEPIAASGGNAPSSNDEGTALSELDKEWVDRARAVIERAQDDPHVQSRELAKVRAEYLRVRFDKHIKASEGQST